jgi:hypothetical protein
MEKSYLCFLVMGIGFIVIASSLSKAFATNNSEDQIKKETDKISKIMTDKIKNDPELSDYSGHCYKTVNSLKSCTDKIAQEMQPLYDEAQKKLADDSN